jgi:hypothetical protein
VDFNTFTLHMGVGILFVMATTNVCLRAMFWNINTLRFTEPQDVRGTCHILHAIRVK